MKELSELSIGYPFNVKRLDMLNDLYNAIDYINNSNNVSNDTILKIIQYYDN